MKFIGKLLVYLLVALLIVLLALYILLQTRWGAAQVSSWITVNTDYELSFDKMNHRFSSPSHLILENVTFGRDGKPATLVAKKVDIGLSSRQITAPLHIFSRYEADAFCKKIEQPGSRPLCDLTGGIHLHTLRAADAPTLDRVVQGLRDKGFLLSEDK